MNAELLNLVIKGVVESVIFSAIGMMFFGVAFFLINKIAPFSIRKEIEEDQNTALGVIMAGVLIGLSIIMSAAIQG